MKKTARKILSYKAEGKKITSLTAYDYQTAKYFDEAGIDFLLVGDSLGHVILGYDSTTKVSMEEMKIFTGAVSRGAKEALVVADMPFMSYQTSESDAYKNAGELIKAGAGAVKIEGGSEYIQKIISHMVDSGIPVMGHLGFTPQSVNTLGGNFVQGKDFEATLKLLEEAKRVEAAGAFAVVLEMVPVEVAKFITEQISIPTIGIGAGNVCDGQILVSDDILGKFDGFSPKFVRKYASLGEVLSTACKKYIEDVENSSFPASEETFYLKEEERIKLEDYIKNFRA